MVTMCSLFLPNSITSFLTSRSYPSFSTGATLWTRSAWTWSMPASRCALLSPTSPAPAFSMSSAPTSGWLLSPNKMSMLQWCSSSCTRCVTSWRPTLGRSVRRISRTTSCLSMSCWMVSLFQKHGNHFLTLFSQLYLILHVPVNRITSNQTRPPLNGMLSWQSSAVAVRCFLNHKLSRNPCPPAEKIWKVT